MPESGFFVGTVVRVVIGRGTAMCREGGRTEFMTMRRARVGVRLRVRNGDTARDGGGGVSLLEQVVGFVREMRRE